MPPPIGRRRIEEFRRAFTGEIDSLAALYRDAAADMMDVLADAATLAGQRGRAVALLRQYQTILADLGDDFDCRQVVLIDLGRQRVDVDNLFRALCVP